MVTSSGGLEPESRRYSTTTRRTVSDQNDIGSSPGRLHESGGCGLPGKADQVWAEHAGKSVTLQVSARMLHGTVPCVGDPPGIQSRRI